MIGQTVGNYRILEKRGEGGMGLFFKATDLQLDRIVGLKTLRPELLADPDFRRRLQTEARSLARLVHQNIANVLHYLEDGENHFIVMEYVEGRDLAERVRQSGLLPIDELGPIVAQICAAISYANSKNVIHRDLKPSNIMITDDGTVKVTDFGIAKILGDSVQTRTGMAAGSLHYMAPEQIRTSGVDARTDVYQLGATLYELATGRRPFVSESEYELMTMHLNTPPESPSSVNPRVSPALDAVILKALAKSPDDRFQTAAELNDAWQAALSGQAPDSHSVDPDATVVGRIPPAPRVPGERGLPKHPEQTGSEPKRRRVWPWIAGLAAVAAVVLAVVLLQHKKPVEEPPATRQEPQPVAAEASTVTVVAELPPGVTARDIALSVMTINHPDSGISTDTVAITGTVFRQRFTVSPTPSLGVRLEGFDRNGKKIFSGGSTQAAPEGGHIEINLPLTAVAVTPPPTEKVTPPPSHNLAVNIVPFSAREQVDRIWIDGHDTGAQPRWEYALKKGRHTVRVQIGRDRLTDTVTVGSAGVAQMTFFISAERGRLSVSASFGTGGGFGNIWLDGRATEYGTPFELRNVLAGPHEVTVKKEGYHPRGGAKFVSVKANSRSRAHFEMLPD